MSLQVQRVLAGVDRWSRPSLESAAEPLSDVDKYLKWIDVDIGVFRGDGPFATKQRMAIRSYQSILAILDAIEESGATRGNSKLDKAVYVTRSYWDRTFDPHHVTPESLATFTDAVIASQKVGSFQKLIDKARAALAATPTAETHRKVEGMTLRNREGSPHALDEIERVVKVAASHLKRVGWGKLLHGDLFIVRGEQLRGKTDPKHTGALYDREGVFMVYPPQDTRAAPERLIHELGHRLWFAYLDAAHRRDWTASWHAVGASGHKYVTPYAKSGGPHEDFSEVFAHLCMGKHIPEVHMNRLREVGVVR